MGAWGVEPFDNDEAADWASDFDGADRTEGIRMIERALEVPAESEYLEEPDGAVAVAAAQLVAWIADPATIEPSAYTESVVGWMERVQASASPGLIDAARGALDRVVGNESELAELWAEADNEQWSMAIQRIRSSLDATP